MSALFVGERDLGPFLEAIIRAKVVVGPVAKRKKFVFDQLESAEDLRLDYDVTILGPWCGFVRYTEPVYRYAHIKGEL